MVRGLYTGWTGMFNEQKRLDVISNNLANSSTVGYKKEGVTSQSFDDVYTIKIRDETVNNRDEYIGNMTLGVKIGEVYTDYTQGAFRETGNTYDLAIEGNGFFTVEYTDNNGDVSTRYTRAGQFHKTQEGYIVTSDGHHLLNDNGEWLQISVDAADVYIDEQGNIYEDNEAVDKITLVDFEDYDYLKKFADTMYMPVEGAEQFEADGIVRQGFMEQSNVNVVNEMVQMISITRAYEANQKVVKAMDNTLDLAVNSVGKV